MNWIAILLLCAIPASGYCQQEDFLESGLLYRTRMDKHLPCEFLRVTLAPDSDVPYRDKLVKVLLLASDRKTVLQEMREGGELDFYGGSTAEQGDFNFDGYRDFRTCLLYASGSGGRMYVHFLYDPKGKRYVRCPQLDELSSPYADANERTISSYSRGGGMYSTACKYRWSAGKLIMISMIWRDRDEKGWFTEYSDFRDGKKVRSRRFYSRDSPGQSETPS